MPSFAVTLRSRPAHPDGVLVVLDEPHSAEEIASELRRRGHDVVVEEFRGDMRAVDRRSRIG
jgi:hypothetical protein